MYESVPRMEEPARRRPPWNALAGHSPPPHPWDFRAVAESDATGTQAFFVPASLTLPSGPGGGLRLRRTARKDNLEDYPRRYPPHWGPQGKTM